MLNATQNLQDFLASWSPGTAVSSVELYIFTLVTGETFYYSGGQLEVVAPLAATTSPRYQFLLGPKFKRIRTKKQIGPQIDEIEVEIYAGLQDVLGFSGTSGLTWQQALHYGLFDGAYCEVLRCFVTPPNVVQGTITWFYGRVGDIKIGRTKTSIRVKSLLDLLTIQMPHRLFQSACNFKFGGLMCGYNRVAGKNALGVATGLGQVTIMALAGSSQTIIATDFVPTPANAYHNGTLIGLTGANHGFTRTAGLVQKGFIYFFLPWVFPVLVGDTFYLQPGCNKTQRACSERQNSDRYGGFPWIPPPEVAV